MHKIANSAGSSPATYCRVCGSQSAFLWRGNLLDYDVGYFECDDCRYVQTEEPHWLEQAYGDAINISDTGIMSRNIGNARIVLATLLAINGLKQSVVDFAGGHGILVRLLRDYGIDAYWQDRYCENLVARGFEYTTDHTQSVSLVTAFESFEHFLKPDSELEEMLAIAPNVLLSTLLISDPAPMPDSWWYYGKEHGQHIGFFRFKTLQYLAMKHGKHLLSAGQYHLLAEKPVNRLGWQVLVLFNKLLPSLLRIRLKPKTWEDHIKTSSLP